ncbi:MAG: CPBP family intramembrane metalloprotease [Phyllobacteriaceae bacterium]|nr:CPBP family intramembrane metalloprotease [Phyllobacteriaceae bacterium]
MVTQTPDQHRVVRRRPARPRRFPQGFRRLFHPAFHPANHQPDHGGRRRRQSDRRRRLAGRRAGARSGAADPDFGGRGVLSRLPAAESRGALWLAADLGLLPALAFSLLHWRGGISMQMNLAMFGGILAFALALTALMARTGSLAASMGAHFGNNLMAILFVSHDDLFAQAALFNGMPLHLIDAGWASAAGQLAATAGMVAIGFLALMHPRSPLALDAVRGHNGRVLT